MLPRWIFVGALWLLFTNSVAFSQRTSIKINDGDPKPAAGAGAASAAGANAGTPYGYGAGSTLGRGAGARGTWQSAPPPLFRPPNPPSGPQPYQALAGQCFQMKTGQYQYEMCPFQNVTQRAASLAPGSLYVILGVWGEWEMNGLQRVAMIYTDGTACASGTRRQVKALLECGDAPRIHDVTEPSTCHYEIHFAHPAACPHSSEQTQTQEQAAQTGSTPESTESSTTISPPQQQQGSQEGSAVVMEAQPTAGQSCPELTAELTAVKRELTMNQATSNRMRSCIMVLAGILSDATSLTEADTTVCSEFLVA